MILQDQTIFSDKDNGIKGNCLITAYACYMDLEVDRCPQIQYLFDCREPNGFWDDVLELWLEMQGYERISFPEDYDPYFKNGHTDYYFAYGFSERGVLHQVIFKEGKIFHDPHPSRSGIINIKGYEVLHKK